MTSRISARCVLSPSHSTEISRLTCTNTQERGPTDAGTAPKDSPNTGLYRRTRERIQERSPSNASSATRRLLRHRILDGTSKLNILLRKIRRLYEQDFVRQMPVNRKRFGGRNSLEAQMIVNGQSVVVLGSSNIIFCLRYIIRFLIK